METLEKPVENTQSTRLLTYKGLLDENSNIHKFQGASGRETYLVAPDKDLPKSGLKPQEGIQKVIMSGPRIDAFYAEKVEKPSEDAEVDPDQAAEKVDEPGDSTKVNPDTVAEKGLELVYSRLHKKKA